MRSSYISSIYLLLVVYIFIVYIFSLSFASQLNIDDNDNYNHNDNDDDDYSYTNNENINTINSLLKKKFSLNIQEASLNDVFILLAEKADLKLTTEEILTEKVNYNFSKITLFDALKKITKDRGLLYSLKNRTLRIYKNNTSILTKDTDISKVGRNISSNHESNIISSPKIEMRHFTLNFLNSRDVKERISPLLSADDKIINDESTNSLLFYGRKETETKINLFIDSFDKMPTQILIEAQIVEITKSKSRELGVSFGNSTGNNLSVNFSGKTSKEPNFGLGLKFGVIDGGALQLNLAAAEASGDAKIISRPNVVTINNVAANIKSGITYHVKTLTSQSTQPSTGSSSGTSSAAIAGGIQAITAGLELQVLPTTMGDNQVKLKIDVTNSEPEESSTVDGIPGIIDNHAETTVIIKNNQTATLAGLIKNTRGNSKNGTPILSEIPFLGWLFKNTLETKKDTELLIFITPHLISNNSYPSPTPSNLK
ncbi:MAG: hypothetical protein HQK49_05065 [Oligoflexia bacterium]|nr:hypothetical protein [Oligoflexia bacterium]